MPGKTPMWGNPMRERERERERERDLIIQLQESTYQQQLHNFQPREKYLTAPKLSQKFLPRKMCQVCTVVRLAHKSSP
jgi:hypothetical protein